LQISLLCEEFYSLFPLRLESEGNTSVKNKQQSRRKTNLYGRKIALILATSSLIWIE